MCCARRCSKLRDQIRFFRFGNYIDCEVLNLAINFDEYVYCILRWAFKRQICLTSPPTTYPLHSGSALLIWLHDFSKTCWKNSSAHFNLRKSHSDVFSRIQVEGWAGTRDKIYREKISTLVRAVGEINNIKWRPSVIQSLWFGKLVIYLSLNYCKYLNCRAKDLQRQHFISVSYTPWQWYVVYT